MFKLFSKYVNMSCFLVYHRDATRYALISFFSVFLSIGHAPFSVFYRKTCSNLYSTGCKSNKYFNITKKMIEKIRIKITFCCQ